MASYDEIATVLCAISQASSMSNSYSLIMSKAQRLTPIAGSPPDMIHPPEGCPFAPRCPYARGICMTTMPPYTTIGENRRSMCWLLTPEAPLTDNPFKHGGEVLA